MAIHPPQSKRDIVCHSKFPCIFLPLDMNVWWIWCQCFAVHVELWRTGMHRDILIDWRELTML